MKPRLISALLAVCAFLLAAGRINHGLLDSSLPAGPGLTPDESFHLAQGFYLVDEFCSRGPLLFTPSGAAEVFRPGRYLADHPPLGRCLLGVSHELTSWLFTSAEQSVFNVAAARLGACFLFALTVFLLCEFTHRNYDRRTAVVAGLAFLLMPRVVGHARLATLETATTLAWFATFLPLYLWWTKKDVPTTRQCFVGGLLFGILLLTKVQGILVPPLVVGWALWKYRAKAIRPLAVWGLTGGAVFFFGWPWLWSDPVANTLEYLDRAADRQALYVWYFGRRYQDTQVPWHYPLIITLITVPVFVLIPCVARFFQRPLDDKEKLIVASTVWPLLVFAFPGTPVYDGSRLFLVIMPTLALLAARGCVLLCSVNSRRQRVTLFVLLGSLAAWSLGKCVSPFSIDSYNVAVLNERGAQRLGMDTAFWVDGLNGDFWKQVPVGSTVYLAPVSHQYQLSDLKLLTPIVADRNLTLQPFRYDPEKQRGLILLNHRLADLRPALRTPPKGAVVVAETQFRGVTLARLVDTSQVTWPEVPDWPIDQR